MSVSISTSTEKPGAASRSAVVLTVEAHPDETAALRAQLREERRAHAIQRANAEQARRAADCLHSFYAALLPLLALPCLVLDRDGGVAFWSDALARQTGIAAASATGQSLETLFPPEAAEALVAAFRVAAYAAEAAPSAAPPAPTRGIFSDAEALPGATFALLPLCRVPGCLESCLILFTFLA